MPGLACLNRLSTEVKSKRSPVCDCTTAAHALQRSKVHLGRAGYGTGAETGAGMAAGGHQNVCSWKQCDTWCFPRHTPRQGCFLICQLRLCVVFPTAVASLFLESEDACCCHVLTMTRETIVSASLSLHLFQTGTTL